MTTISDPAVTARTALRVPSTTTTRFVLLMAVLLVGAIPFYRWWADIVLRWTPQLSTCQALDHDRDPAAYARALAACPEAIGRDAVLLELAVASGLVVLALALYVAQPAWSVRFHRLAPLDPAVHPQIARELAELVAAAGLRRAPRFMVRPSLRAEGLTFGRFPNYQVRLDAGLIMLYRSNPELFRAIVRHELAHLQNRDVDLTFLALSIWRAFIALVAVPAVTEIAVRLISSGLRWSGYMTDQLIAVAFIVVVVRLAVRGVLRAREYHADLRSTGEDGADGALGAALASRPAGTWRQRVRWRLGTHPSPARRVDVLRRPSLLFRLAATDAAVAGAATGFGLGGLQLAAGGLVGTFTGPTELVTGLVAATPLAAVLAAGAVRAAYGRMALGRTLPLGITAAVCAAGGVIAGESASLLILDADWQIMLTAQPWTALWLAVLLGAAMILTIRWLTVSAGIWLDGRLPGASWRVAAGVAAATVAPLSVTLVYWQFAHQGELPHAGEHLAFAYLSMLLEYPGLPAAALVAMAALPLLAGLRRRSAAAPTVPLAIGIGAGFVAAIASVVFLVDPLDRWWSVTVMTPAVTGGETSDMRYATGIVAIVAATAACVAAYAGRRGVTLGAVHGLLTAGAGGAFVIAVACVNRLVRVWSGDQDWSWSALRSFDSVVFRQALIVSVAIVVAAALAGRITGWARRLPAWPVSAVADRRVPHAAVAATAVLLVAATALQGTTGVRDLPPLPQPTASPGPSPQPDPDPYRPPADLGMAALCRWTPWTHLADGFVAAAKQGRTAADLAWVGTILAHADDARLAKLGVAFTSAVRSPDPQAGLEAMAAIGTLCFSGSVEPTPGTPLPRRDACLVGTWRSGRQAATFDLARYGLGDVAMTSTSTYTSTLAGDGHGEDAAAAYVMTGATSDSVVTTTSDFRRGYTWTTVFGIYLQSRGTGPFTTVVATNGKPVDTLDVSEPSDGSATTYTCTATTLTLTDASGSTQQFTRGG